MLLKVPTILSWLFAFFAFPLSTYAQIIDLPVIRIDTENGAVIADRENYVNMTFSLTDPNNPENNISTISNQQIRGRGNSTWAVFSKKPYRIRFRSNTSLFGRAAYRNWVLLAEFKDPTFLITPVAFELGRNVFDHLPFTNTYQHVHLYLNGNYEGIYGLTEHRQATPDGVGAPGRIKVDLLEGWFVELGINYDENPKFRTGNYDLPIMIKTNNAPSGNPDDDNNPFYDFVKNDWNELCDLMTSESFPENGYRNLIDMNTFIDFSMVQEIVHNVEFSRPASLFAYKDKGGKISMGSLWDFDAAFGFLWNDHRFFYDISWNWEGPSRYLSRHAFFQRFFEDPLFLVKYKERWNEKYNDIVAVSDFIEDLGEKIRPSVAMDTERWTTVSGYYPKGYYLTYGADEGDHALQVDRMASWWNRRMLWLNDELNSVNVLPASKDFGTTGNHSEISPQTFTLVAFGDMTNLSATLQKGESSDFEIVGEFNKTPTGDGGYLATISVKPKSSLPAASYTDVLVLSGSNQGNPFLLEAPLSLLSVNALKMYPNSFTLRMYPNPFTSEVHLLGVEGYTLQVINAGGIVVHTQDITNREEIIRLEHLPQSVYFFRAEKDGITKTVKAVKN